MSAGQKGGTPPAAPPSPEAPAAPVRTGLLTKRTLIVVATGAVFIALLIAIWQVVQILLLILASILLAILLRTLAVFVSDHTPLSRGWSLAAVTLTLLGSIVLAGVLYGPYIADGFYQMGRALPATLDQVRRSLEPYPWGPPLLNALSRAGNGLGNPEQISRIAGIFSTAVGAVGSFLVVLVLGIYFAAEPRTYTEGVAQLFPPERRGRLAEALDHMGQALRSWLLGRVAAMVAVGVMTGAGLALLGVPFAFVLGLLAALLDFVPNIGPIIAAVPAVLIGLGESGSTALYVALLYFVIQSIEGYLIEPYIQQKIVSMPPALLLGTQLVMGAGFGVLGLLLAPAAALVGLVLVRMLYVRDVLGERVELP